MVGKKLKYDNLPKVAAIRINPGTDTITAYWLDNRERIKSAPARIQHQAAMAISHLAAARVINKEKFIPAAMLHGGMPHDFPKVIYHIRQSLIKEWKVMLPLESDGASGWRLGVDPEEIRFEIRDLDQCDDAHVVNLVRLVTENNPKSIVEPLETVETETGGTN